MKRGILTSYIVTVFTVLLCSGYSPAYVSDTVQTDTSQGKTVDILKYSSGTHLGNINTVQAKKYKDGELLVKFKKGTSDSQKKDKHTKHRAKVLKKFKHIDAELVRLDSGAKVKDAIAEYQADPDVEYAEPNYIVTAQKLPNDPYFTNLWGLYNTGQTGGTSGADIKAPLAWDITTGSSDVIVAVIDTGIDYTHGDLTANVWVNASEIAGNGVDDDGDGYVDDVRGINAITGTGDPFDDHGHGTHVAGTIGAVGNNGAGVAGVNWSVKIIACKFLDSTGYGATADAITCLDYIHTMKDRGVNIVATNNSWGCSGNCYSQALYDAINAQQQILFITAAGNNGTDNDHASFYPANYRLPNVISVAATDSHDEKAGFSDQGRHSVHVGAPGVDVYSTLPALNLWGIKGGYGLLSGTSMATPHVTGLAALINSVSAPKSWIETKNLILAGGDNLAALEGKTITGKRINAYGSLTCDNRPVFSLLEHPTSITVGVPSTLSALSINCGSPAGPVLVTTASGTVFQLADDGNAPDLATGDGIFTGTWVPSSMDETLLFSSPSGTDTITFRAPPPIPPIERTFNFTGHVTYVDDFNGLLEGRVSVGDTVTGSFGYDFNAQDTNPLPTVADYWHYSAPYGISVNVGGLTFMTDPADTQFLAEVVNDHQVCYTTGCVLEDHFVLHSYNNIFSIPMDDQHIAWQLDDPTATALSDVALPRSFNLASWSQDFGLSVEGRNMFDPMGGFFGIRMIVTSVTTTLDTEPPTGSIVINGGASYTNIPVVTLTLSASDASGVSQMKFSNDNIIWSAPEPYATMKAWTLLFGDGKKTVYVAFKDTADNWSGPFNASIILDTRPPSVSITSPAAGLTNNRTPLLSYSVSDGAVVVRVDGVVVNKVSGNTLDALADGPHTVRVEATDAAGNTGIAEVNFTIDTTAPVVSITSPAAGFTNNKTPLLSYTVSDGSVVVKVDGSVVNKTSGSKLDPLADGPHTVRVEATDAAGNRGAAEVSFTVDTVSPAVSITSPAAGLTNNRTPLLSYSVNDGAVVVKVDGSVVNKTSGSQLDPLADGQHTVRVEATDAAGNIGVAEVTFTVDTVPPTVSIDPVPTPIKGTFLTVKGTREKDAVVSVSVSPSAVVGPVSYGTDTTWSCTINGLTRKTSYTVTAMARDTAGNTASASTSMRTK